MILTPIGRPARSLLSSKPLVNESARIGGTFLSSLRNLIGPRIFFGAKETVLLRKLLVGFLTLRGRKVGRPGQEDSTSVNGEAGGGLLLVVVLAAD